MDGNKRKKVISPKAEQVLELLSKQKYSGKFYLAGGTALALQLGHRKSVDLDLFSEYPFKPNILLQKLKKSFGENIKERHMEKGTLYVYINGVQTSFIEYKYPLLDKFFKNAYGIKIAGIKDIAAMKISSIVGRSSRKDLIDIYYIIKYGYQLDEIIRLFYDKYGEQATDPIIIYKSFNYFEYAEDEPMPVLTENISWNSIKSFINKITASIFRDKFV